MRMAFVCADQGIPIFGNKGCSVHIREFIGAAQKENVEIDFFGANVKGRSSAIEGIHIYSLPHFPEGSPAEREKAAISVNHALLSALGSAGPFDLIYERYSLWSYISMEYANTIGVPGFLEIDAPLIDEQSCYRELVNKEEAKRTANRVFTAASRIIAVSSEVAAFVERQGFGDKVTIIPNGVNPAYFENGPKPSLPAANGEFTIGFLGSLKPWHGLSSLIDIFSILYQRDSNLRLLIVGDGPGREGLMCELSERNLMKAAHLTGAVSHEVVPALLASMDVAVAPYPRSGEFYFSPLKIFEYMAAGLPIVASSVGQIREIIQHQQNGLLCPPGESLPFVQAIESLKRDHDLRIRLGESAKDSVLRSHTWSHTVRKVLQLAALPQTACSLNGS